MKRRRDSTLRCAIALSVALIVVSPCLAAVDVPVYPGAVLDEQATRMIHRSKPDHPEYVVYNAPDSFEKIEGFYKKLGATDVPHSRNISAEVKYVVLRLPGKTYFVQLSWIAGNKNGATTLLFGLPPA